MSAAVHGCCRDGTCDFYSCMALPPQKTCGDCVHARRCNMLFGAEPGRTSCDFYPRRFVEAAQ